MKTLTPGSRMLLSLACTVIILSGLRYMSDLMVPILLAFFLAVLNMPVTQWLQRHRVPRLIAVMTTVMANLAVISIFVAFTLDVMLNFLPKAPGYVDDMRASVQAWGDRLFQSTPILNKTDQLQESKNTFYEMVRRQAANFTYELPTVNQVLDQVTALTGMVFVVFIVMVFFLSESGRMESRLNAIREVGGPNLTLLARVSHDIQRYLGIKTVVSVLTGLLAWLLTLGLGLEFPLLWGITAFALNFIPAIGSIIAAVPPALVALSQEGAWICFLVLMGYLMINMLVGNLLEPLVMGRGFGVSTSVVVLSVLFWGWVWGVAGMFLAIPLTMLVKVILQNTEEFRWLSVAMEKPAAELIRVASWRRELFDRETAKDEPSVPRDAPDQVT